MAKLVCSSPAERFGLTRKGDIQVGKDADFVLFDRNRQFVVRAAESPSSQGYTPFEGIEITGQVMATYLRGKKIYEHGKPITSSPIGEYLRRPQSKTSKLATCADDGAQ